METTFKTHQSKTSGRSKHVSYTRISIFWNNLEPRRFGIIPIIAVIIGCAGGIAAAFGAEADTFKLALTAFPSIIALALVLAVAPMKAIMYASFMALLLDLIVLIF